MLDVYKRQTFGYPSIVNLVKLAKGDKHLQAALASLFTMKYGSIVVMEQMTYAEALPLYGLRQNVFTDPQKPMKVEPGIYPLNGADENSLVVTTVAVSYTHLYASGRLPEMRCGNSSGKSISGKDLWRDSSASVCVCGCRLHPWT